MNKSRYLNIKGQAFIESILLTQIIVGGLLFVIVRLILYQKSYSLDFLLRKTVICLSENRSDCLSRLRQRSAELELKIIDLKTRVTPPTYEVQYDAQDRFRFKYSKRWLVQIPQIQPTNAKIQ